MSQIIYTPDNVGKEFITKQGRIRTNRKYHMTPTEMGEAKKRWEKEIENVDKRTKDKAGLLFFNPYRKGIYYYQIQTLFLLGANEWHSFTEVLRKLEIYTSKMVIRKLTRSDGNYTVWDKFKGKRGRDHARRCKDHIGRVQENFVFFQRLTGSHPYGYKLYQVCSAVDIKRVSRDGFEQGVYFYRLSTYDTMKEAFPIKDFRHFTFPRQEGKYVNYKFVGTILTKDRTIVRGVEV